MNPDGRGLTFSHGHPNLPLEQVNEAFNDLLQGSVVKTLLTF